MTLDAHRTGLAKLAGGTERVASAASNGRAAKTIMDTSRHYIACALFIILGLVLRGAQHDW